jgi:hypothetical protein
MSNVSVLIAMYHETPMHEFTINLHGNTTLCRLRDIIQDRIGISRAIDRAWVADIFSLKIAVHHTPLMTMSECAENLAAILHSSSFSE